MIHNILVELYVKVFRFKMINKWIYAVYIKRLSVSLHKNHSKLQLKNQFTYSSRALINYYKVERLL